MGGLTIASSFAGRLSVYFWVKSKTPVFQTSATAHYRSPTPALKSGQYKAKTAQKSGYKAIIPNGRLRVNMKINVKQIRASYRFDFFDNEWYCNHDNLEVIQPCCSGREAEWCGCQGEPEFYCPNPDCDGIEDEVVNICAREELVQCLA